MVKYIRMNNAFRFLLLLLHWLATNQLCLFYMTNQYYMYFILTLSAYVTDWPSISLFSPFFKKFVRYCTTGSILGQQSNIYDPLKLWKRDENFLYRSGEGKQIYFKCDPITLLSSLYDWNTAEKNLKSFVIYPSILNFKTTILFFNRHIQITERFTSTLLLFK